jgi:hypothetical protein
MLRILLLTFLLMSLVARAAGAQDDDECEPSLNAQAPSQEFVVPKSKITRRGSLHPHWKTEQIIRIFQRLRKENFKFTARTLSENRLPGGAIEIIRIITGYERSTRAFYEAVLRKYKTYEAGLEAAGMAGYGTAEPVIWDEVDFADLFKKALEKKLRLNARSFSHPRGKNLSAFLNEYFGREVPTYELYLYLITNFENWDDALTKWGVDPAVYRVHYRGEFNHDMALRGLRAMMDEGLSLKNKDIMSFKSRYSEVLHDEIGIYISIPNFRQRTAKLFGTFNAAKEAAKYYPTSRKLLTHQPLD